MKKRSLIIAVLLACAVFTGCGKKAPETEAPTEAPTEVVTEAVTEPITEVQTEAETEKEDSMNRTRALKGLVVSSDASQLTIQTERGKQLQFSITGADIQVTGGIAAGNNVTILYKGAVEGTDTSNAKVLMVKDLAADETPVTEGELMTEAEEADPEAGAGVLEGTISELNTDRIVILANDGDAYYFSTMEADINLKNGTQVGNYVTVSYQGDIHGPDLVAATAVTDAQEETDKIAYGKPDGETDSYISGTVIDCTSTTMTLLTDEEEEVVLDTSKASQVYKYGFTYGCYVIAAYKGEDASSVPMVTVYDYVENAAAEETADTEISEGQTAEEQADGEDAGAADAAAVPETEAVLETEAGQEA